MKETKYYAYEVAYDCPYCGNTQGWTNYPDEDDYEEPKQCDKCKQEFKLVKGLK